MKEKKELQKRQEEISCKCELCGRPFKTGHFTLNENEKNYCRQCQAEVKSCGCADDD